MSEKTKAYIQVMETKDHPAFIIWDAATDKLLLFGLLCDDNIDDIALTIAMRNWDLYRDHRPGAKLPADIEAQVVKLVVK